MKIFTDLFKQKEVVEKKKRNLHWYEYDQNNSGGGFMGSDRLSELVYVQAYTFEEANKIFTKIVDEDNCWDYCECCGERWSLCWSEKDGEPYPKRYGKSIFKDQIFGRFLDTVTFNKYDGTVIKMNENSDVTEIKRKVCR